MQFLTREFWTSTRGSLIILICGTHAPLWALTGEQLALYICVAGTFLLALIKIRGPIRRVSVPIDAIVGFLFNRRLHPGLGLVVVAGAVVVATFGFAPNSLRSLFSVDSPWEAWHRGAIGWAALVSLYWLTRFLYIVEPKSYAVMLYVVIGALLVAAIFWHDPRLATRQMSISLLIAFSSAVVDVVVWRNSDERRKRNPASKTASELLGYRREALATLFFADLPTILAFLLIFAYVLSGPSSERLDVFASGAVSFQLLASKSVFILIEARGLEVLDGSTVSARGA